ncbi:sugar phosphate isomerase/epimerase family protein [Candidatus Epulonipiscium viviparus]|uniref:sugar phosphate isomerase/epimerase family protein n=1 Tax=Candidatus Epulonipiscium viviparus TaxID=420336 RepID=UPI002738106E|nr:sugar phosphate isomerase/epimerase [Candidatus Epulopiscium viviparus]
MAKFGVQMMMLKTKVEEEGIYNVMKKIKDIGFTSLEISQIPMTAENVAQMQRACKDFDMEIGALSAATEPMFPGMESLSTHYDKIVADCKALNCNFLRIGMMPFNVLGNKDAFVAFAKKCDDYATKLAEEGIKLYYHNHHVEFIKYDGQILLDILKEETTHLGFEIDVHWAQRAGVNPVELIKKYAGRLDLVHLKDYRIAEPNFEDVDFKDVPTVMQRFIQVIQFAEIGEGNLDFKAIVDASLVADAKYLFIEQDDTYGKDPYESLQISKDALVNLGYTNLL